MLRVWFLNIVWTLKIKPKMSNTSNPVPGAENFFLLSLEIHVCFKVLKENKLRYFYSQLLFLSVLVLNCFDNMLETDVMKNKSYTSQTLFIKFVWFIREIFVIIFIKKKETLYGEIVIEIIYPIKWFWIGLLLDNNTITQNSILCTYLTTQHIILAETKTNIKFLVPILTHCCWNTLLLVLKNVSRGWSSIQEKKTKMARGRLLIWRIIDDSNKPAFVVYQLYKSINWQRTIYFEKDFSIYNNSKGSRVIRNEFSMSYYEK